MTKFDVQIEWDGDAAVWVAFSDTLPGFALEAADMDTLRKRSCALAAELIELNHVPIDKDGASIRFPAGEEIRVAA